MAAPEWRNVAPPDLNSSLQGLGLFSQLIRQAGNRVSGSITDVQDRAYEQSQTELARRMAGMTGDQIQAGLADQSLMAGIGGLKAQDFTNAGNTATQALQRESAAIALRGENRNFEQRSALDAATPVLQQAYNLHRAGEAAEAAALMSTIPAAELGFRNMNDVNKFIEEGGSNFRNQRTSDQNFTITGNQETRDATNHSNTQSDRIAERIAQNWIDEMYSRGHTTQDLPDLLASDSSVDSNTRFFASRFLGDAAKQVADGTGGGSGGGATGGGGDGSGNGRGILDPAAFASVTPATVSWDANRTAVRDELSKALPPAVVAGFLGNFDVEGGYGGAAGDNGTAFGIAQWRGPRVEAFKRRNGGKAPHEASAAEQARHVLWELTTPEGRAAAGLSEANANKIMNAKDPTEAAALIDEYYEISSGAHRERRVAAAQGYMGLLDSRWNQNVATAEAALVQGDAKNQTSLILAQAAAQPALDSRSWAVRQIGEGGNERDIRARANAIEQIVKDTGMTANVAAAFIANNGVTTRNGISGALTRVGEGARGGYYDAGGGVIVPKTALDTFNRDLRSGAVADAAASQMSNAQHMQDQAAVTQQRDAAQARLDNLRRRASVNPAAATRLAPAIRNQEAQVRQLNEQVQLRQANSGAAANARFDPPPPAAPTSLQGLLAQSTPGRPGQVVDPDATIPLALRNPDDIARLTGTGRWATVSGPR